MKTVPHQTTLGTPYLFYKRGFIRLIVFTLALPNLILSFYPLVGQVNDSLPPPSVLKKLSMEELINIEVTSVSKVPQRLKDVASAIQVITHNDILRSGATSIPEALRLASNLQVAQLSSSAWIISARGFNTTFANKLLVLIDGRTVYTPLFGGVLWELQNVVLEDVERIEVISGPGATLWGANAVNGVINIITKSAMNTVGTYASLGAGTMVNKMGEIRYGRKIGNDFFCRVYGKHTSRNKTFLQSGEKNADDWSVTQAGFRGEWNPTEANAVTIQGDFYHGAMETVPNESSFDGQNILARWTHALTDDSDFTLQFYFDRYWRDDAISLADEMETYDLDFQHKFHIGNRQTLLWGIGYRLVDDQVNNRTIYAGIVPEKRIMHLFSGFVQDEIRLSNEVRLTIGTKLLHNIYSGFEIQPSVRAAWNMREGSTLWGAVSRAIRAPSRFDVDYFLPIEPQPPEIPSVAGGPNFESEKLVAFEAGYRIQPNERSSFSFAGFYNVYNDVYSVEALQGTLTYQIQNGSEGESWGGEFSGTYYVVPEWQLRGGYTYFNKDLRNKPGHNFDPAYLGNDAKNMVVLQSMADLPFNFQWDFVARYIDRLPRTIATARVPEYITFDSQITWANQHLQVSVCGQNLMKRRHVEYGTLQIPRSIYAKIALRF